VQDRVDDAWLPPRVSGLPHQFDSQSQTVRWQEPLTARADLRPGPKANRKSPARAEVAAISLKRLLATVGNGDYLRELDSRARAFTACSNLDMKPAWVAGRRGRLAFTTGRASWACSYSWSSAFGKKRAIRRFDALEALGGFGYWAGHGKIIGLSLEHEPVSSSG
jgi:hypothetical protein